MKTPRERKILDLKREAWAQENAFHEAYKNKDKAAYFIALHKVGEAKKELARLEAEPC